MPHLKEDIPDVNSRPLMRLVKDAPNLEFEFSLDGANDQADVAQALGLFLRPGNRPTFDVYLGRCVNGIKLCQTATLVTKFTPTSRPSIGRIG